MSDYNLTNNASAVGSYNGAQSVSVAAQESSVLMVTELSVAIDATPKVWASGNLVYTISVENRASLPYESLIVSDAIDITQVQLIESSVVISDETATYAYDETIGILTVNLPVVNPGEITTIDFSVQKLTQ